MSPAVVGNALILMAIWKNQLLRTTSYILLGGLAITDLLTGLIVLPFLVASTVIEVNNQLTADNIPVFINRNIPLWNQQLSLIS